MFTIFRDMLRRSIGQILGWGLSIALLGWYIIQFFDTLAKQQRQIQEFLRSFPRELLAFFGDVGKMYTPAGYLTLEFFSYMPLVLGIFAVLAASGLIASDEENGTLDLVQAHPISRTALFAGRLLAFLVATIAILALTWLGFLIGMSNLTLDITPAAMLLPFLSLLAELLFFGTLALLLSLLLPSRSLAATTAGILLVASYFVTSLAQVDEKLKSVARFSPLNYYQSGNAIEGLKWDWFGGLLLASLLFTVLAWAAYARGDIRVGGEGNWGIGWLGGKRTPA